MWKNLCVHNFEDGLIEKFSVTSTGLALRPTRPVYSFSIQDRPPTCLTQRTVTLMIRIDDPRISHVFLSPGAEYDAFRVLAASLRPVDGSVTRAFRVSVPQCSLRRRMAIESGWFTSCSNSSRLHFSTSSGTYVSSTTRLLTCLSCKRQRRNQRE